MTYPQLTYMASPTGMAAGRSKLLAKAQWFIHDARLSRLKSILSQGLAPQNPGASPPTSLKMFGDCGNILCLAPVGGALVVVNKDEPTFRIGIAGVDLPDRGILDWSIQSNAVVDKFCRMCSDCPHKSVDDIFAHCIMDSGSFAALDGVPVAALKVCPKNAPNSDPASWPLLVATNQADFEITIPLQV